MPVGKDSFVWIEGQKDRWEFYTHRGEYWWERFTRNGCSEGASHKGFANLEECKANATRNGYNEGKTNG